MQCVDITKTADIQNGQMRSLCLLNSLKEHFSTWELHQFFFSKVFNLFEKLTHIITDCYILLDRILFIKKRHDDRFDIVTTTIFASVFNNTFPWFTFFKNRPHLFEKALRIVWMTNNIMRFAQ